MLNLSHETSTFPALYREVRDKYYALITEILGLINVDI